MATPIPTNRASFTLDEVVTATRATIRGRGERSEEAIGVTTDSRAVAESNVFVALRGESHDGHVFLPAAASAGAAVLVVERGHDLPSEIGAGPTIVEVEDTLVAWGDLARAHLAKWRAIGGGGGRSVVAITGSAGKTTTKELTAALLAAVAPTHFTAGNLNNRIGVPAVLFALDEGHRFCVLEMGMSLPGELDAIASVARPDVAVVVNVGVAHAEGVGGRDGVMREKGAVYRALDEGGIAIVNDDDEHVRRAAVDAKVKTAVTFGRGTATRVPHYQLTDRAPIGEGSRIVLSCTGTRAPRELTLTLPLPGEAAAIDLAAALAAQEAASGAVLSRAMIDRALGGITLSGRGAIRRLERDIVVLDDTYNANPASMRAALATLVEIAGSRRRLVVLGEMKELGALAEDEHRALGDAIADAGVNLAIGCGGLVELALDRAASRGVAVVRARTTEDAAIEALARVSPGDAVLVKGSRGVQAEKVVAALDRLTLTRSPSG